MRPLVLAKAIAILCLKLFALLFVGGMLFVQIPELRYDLRPKEPVRISSPAELTRERIPRAAFASVSGEGNFEKAFIYRRYGLSYTYFTIDPYGYRLVVRTYDKVTDEWRDLSRFLGKLKPFEGQPFSYAIHRIYRERMNVNIPENAFFLALDDVPELSGWQVAAVIFASVLWLVMFYCFFVHRWRKAPGDDAVMGVAGEEAQASSEGL